MARNSPRQPNKHVRVIYEYCEKRGHEYETFIRRTLDFSAASFIYYDIKKMMDALAGYLTASGYNGDTQTIEGSRSLYRKLAELAFKDDKDIVEKYKQYWSTGFLDVSYNRIASCFSPSTIERPPHDPSRLAWRFAIARTLTYIRVLPPEDDLLIIRAGDELFDCWDFIKTHPHYIEKSDESITKSVNQHCINELYHRNSNCFDIVVNPDSIGEFKSMIDSNNPKVEPWQETMLIFTGITLGSLGFASNMTHIWLKESKTLWED